MRIERDGDDLLDPDELAPKLCLSADELRRRMKSGLVTSLVEAGLCRLTVRCGGAIVGADGSIIREETAAQSGSSP